MIINTGYALGSVRRTGRAGRGLGQMPSLTAAQYAALTPAQQQAYGNADPNFMNAGPAPPAPASGAGIPASTAALVANPQFSTVPFGASTTTTYTLDSRMAEWAASSIAFPSSLQGSDPMTEALAFAQSYCAQQPVSDCGNINAIASKYGAQVQAAFAAATAAGSLSPAAAPGTTNANQVTSVIQKKPINQSAGGGGTGTRASVNQSAAALAPARFTPPVVVNPSPPSLATNTGSSATSPTSAASVANGTTLATVTPSTDLIPGVPNEVLLIGGGALVLVLIAMGGK